MVNFYPRTTTELRAAIIAANNNGQADVIYLNGGLYTLNSIAENEYSGPSGLPVINSPIIIEGNGSTIERLAGSPAFHLLSLHSNYPVTIQNLTLKGGDGQASVWGGGAIFLAGQGEYRFINCTFTENNAGTSGDGGGAINIRGGGTISFDQCRFTNNNGGDLGGAIRILANISVYVNQCSFENNQAGVGGAIENTTAALYISKSEFLSNQATSAYGGAIQNSGHTLLISDCIFQQNTAQTTGGAINALSGVLRLQRCLVKENLAQEYGGAIRTSGSFFDIRESTLEANTSNNPVLGAGAISSDADEAKIYYCEIVGNDDTSVRAAACDARFNYWGAANGPSGAAPGSGDSISTNILYSPWIGAAGPSDHIGAPACPICYAGADSLTSGNPISLGSGEKRLDETDIRLNTPLGVLAFSRHYRQSQQDELDFMGLGWTHDHDIRLSESGGSPNQIAVFMAGNTAIFYDNNADNLFEGAAGSASRILKDGSGYHLTASDESVYHFNLSGQILARNLPNGEVWSYSYSSNLLSEVTDGYGRKLKFVYYTGESGGNTFKNGLLKRVGTQTSTDLASSPQVPYVELDYEDDSSGKGLLTSVQDARGEVWSYRYYGSEPGETDVRWQNFLVERLSPAVDWNGDGSPESSLLLEALAYEGPSRLEITGIQQERGEAALRHSMSFDPQKRSTVETTAGRSTSHSFVNGVYVGTTNPAEERTSQAPSGSYRSSGQGDANGNITELSWSTDGKKLTSVKDALNQTTDFAYDFLDRLFSSTDAEGKLSLYSYTGSLRQPSAIRQLDGTNLVTNGNMELDSSWTAISGAAPTTNERHSSFYAGSYSRRLVASDTNQGIESIGMALLQGKTYHVLAHVRRISGQAKMVLGSSNKLSASSGNAWEVLSMSYTPSANETISLQFRAEGTAGEFYVDEVFVWAAGTVLRWQEFGYDNKGRTLEDKVIDPRDGTSLLQRSLRSYGTSGNENGLLRTSVQKNVLEDGVGESTTTYDYDAQGRLIKTSQSSLMGTCQFNYTVYDAAGNVLGTACGLGNEAAPSDLTALLALYDAEDEQKKHTRITTHVYDEMGRRVQTTNNAGMDRERSSRTIYDALSRVVRTIGNYVPQGSSAPGDWVWNSANQCWEYSASNSTAVSHGTNLDENIISDTVYNERGLVYLRRDVLGRVNLSGYDLADRLVKSIQNASQANYNASYLNGDPALANYVPNSSASDLDIITEQAYDAVGNLVKSIDARGAVHFTVYDALNRPVKTVQNAKATATISLNPGDSAYSAANDPRSASYAISTDPDRDMISETVYDAMGRVQSSKRLLENRGASPVWDETYFVYDGQGRQIRQIQHYVPSNPLVLPDAWIYDKAANPPVWKTGPGGSAISHGSNEQNLITETVYYPDGKVKETIDIARRLSRMVYDGLGRQYMTVSNFVTQPTEPENWFWSDTNTAWEYSIGNAVSHGAKLDENIISFTEYDADGRVLESRNVEGFLQRNAYDTAGRQALSIANYVEQGGSFPIDWLWQNNQWEDGDDNAIARGTDFDQNIISQPAYDSEGRAFQNRDARGNLSRQVYDESGRVVLSIQNYLQQATEPEYWVFESGQWKTEASGTVISHGSNNDQNRLQSSTYDLLGRVFSSRDSKGRETRRIYDALGRTVKTIANYVQQGSSDPANWLWNESLLRWEDGAGNAIAHGAAFDQNLISETIYNKAGQVLASRDARGTETSFTYDAAGRRLSMTTAAKTAQARTNYTCYDKAGRSLRSIQGYVAIAVSPDAWSSETWVFAPAAHGYHSDENCITSYVYDKASRRISTTDPVGNSTQTSYSLDGQVLSLTDPLNVVTAYRYDKRNRRILVVQNFVANGEDPGLWLWDTGGFYKKSGGTAISHDTNNDQNIIVQLEYDIAGRVISQREPRGKLTTYTYDKLGRRKSLTNPLSKVWETSYSEANGASQTILSYPNGYNLVQDFDRFGRSLQLDYGLATNTPKVNFSHDILGNRLSMIENNGTNDIRQTLYNYDNANRLSSVGFDKDGGGTVDETVSYEYDAGGLRTKLTLPGNLSIIYTYDRKGRLMTLTDWDNQCTEFAFDKAERHVRTRRHTGLDSLYQHDAAGRLKALHHLEAAASLEQSFVYTVDNRGNRTKAQELKPRTTGASATTMDHLYAGLVYRGDWRDVGSYHEATNHDASLSLLFYGNTNIELRMGQGPDYSIYDVYIDGTLWQSFDGYAASEGERIISIPLDGSGLHLLEVKNMREKRLNSTGYKIRFKSLYGQPAFDILTIDYSYDDLSRLLSANYSVGADYVYGYDLSGNLVNNNGVTRTYNATNQISNDGTNTLDYDDNGNLVDDGVNSYTWDRANRLLTVDDTSYKYDGAGNRIQQTVSSVVTDYLNDVQPSLVKLLAQTTGNDTQRYVHAPRGIFAMEDASGWDYTLQDGLGSVRNDGMSYDPYGKPMASYAAGYTYASEQVDSNGLSYNRARYYSPQSGVWLSLDPLETPNRYAYVSGNPVNMVDPTGLFNWQTLTTEEGDCVWCIGREGGIGVHPFEDFSIPRSPETWFAYGSQNAEELQAFSEYLLRHNPSSVFYDHNSLTGPKLYPNQTLDMANYISFRGFEFRNVVDNGIRGVYADVPFTCGGGCGSIPPTFTPSPTSTPTATPTSTPTAIPCTSTPTASPTMIPTYTPTLDPVAPTATPNNGYTLMIGVRGDFSITAGGGFDINMEAQIYPAHLFPVNGEWKPLLVLAVNPGYQQSGSASVGITGGFIYGAVRESSVGQDTDVTFTGGANFVPVPPYPMYEHDYTVAENFDAIVGYLGVGAGYPPSPVGSYWGVNTSIVRFTYNPIEQILNFFQGN